MVSYQRIRLKEDWILRGWSDIPWSLFHQKTGEHLKLNREQFYVAASCDGRTDFMSSAFLPKHRYFVRQLLEKGIAEVCGEASALLPYQAYQRAANEHIRGIQWAITGSCNLKCRYCYMEAPTGKPKELSFTDVKKLIDKLRGANILEVALTGGEPFVRRDLPEIMTLLRDNHIRLTDIYTNGTILRTSDLDQIRKLEYNPVFRISYDGWGRHDALRGIPGTEGKVLDSIRRVREAGFQVSVTTMADNSNVDCLMNTYELMKELQVHAWGIARPQSVGCGREVNNRLPLKEMILVCERLLIQWLKDRKPFMLGLEAFYSGAEGRDHTGQGVSVTESRSDGESFACSSCRKWPYLSPEGRLMPCISYGDTEWGEQLPSLVEKEFEECWQDPKLRSLLDIRKKDVLAKNHECEACSLLSECGTGCRTSALLHGEGLLGKDKAVCELWQNGYKNHFTEIAAKGCW